MRWIVFHVRKHNPGTTMHSIENTVGILSARKVLVREGEKGAYTYHHPSYMPPNVHADDIAREIVESQDVPAPAPPSLEDYTAEEAPPVTPQAPEPPETLSILAKSGILSCTIAIGDLPVAFTLSAQAASPELQMQAMAIAEKLVGNLAKLLGSLHLMQQVVEAKDREVLAAQGDAAAAQALADEAIRDRDRAVEEKKQVLGLIGQFDQLMNLVRSTSASTNGHVETKEEATA
jgi:hypothetical protein